MKKINLFFMLCLCMMFVSCGSMKSYIATYFIDLQSVESPADAKQQFGETKVVKFEDNGISKYRYEDDYIEIVWNTANQKKFIFVLKNKSGHTMKINWDDISYVGINGQVGRVMHAGVKYNERNSSQPATTIPKDANITDMLLPTENVYFDSYWKEAYLFPCIYKSQESMDAEKDMYKGKQMKILMPIMIENVQNDYVFTFVVN